MYSAAATSFQTTHQPKRISSNGSIGGDGDFVLVRAGGRGSDAAEKDIKPPSIRNRIATSTTRRQNNHRNNHSERDVEERQRGRPQDDDSSEQGIRNASNLDTFHDEESPSTISQNHDLRFPTWNGLTDGTAALLPDSASVGASTNRSYMIPPPLEQGLRIEMQPGAVAVRGTSQRYRSSGDDCSTLADTRVTVPGEQPPAQNQQHQHLQQSSLSSMEETMQNSTPIMATVVDPDSGSHGSSINQPYGMVKDVPFRVLMGDRRIKAFLCFSALIMVGLAVGLSLALTQNQPSVASTADMNNVNQDGTEPPANPNTLATSSPSAMATWKTFLASISPDGGAAWNISTSPQYRALEELQTLSQQQEGGLDLLYDESRIGQRYAAQVLRFVIQEGAGVDIVQPWERRFLVEADAFDECTWPFIVCDGQGQLRIINITSNQYAFTLPEELVLLTTMKEFLASTNLGYGTLPSILSRLDNLEILILDTNKFWGTIPSELATSARLIMFNAGYNRLRGSIPTEFGLSTTLQSMTLHFNKLTGTLPSELFANRELEYLSLDTNFLNGTLPTELGSASTIYLYANDNNFTGTIPTELGNMVNLQALQMNGNDFTGPIPSQLGQLLQLQDLALANNLLTGSIPIELTLLTHLWGLKLGLNQLTGTIHTELGRLRVVTNLELGTNDLEGTIPTQLGYLTGIGKSDFVRSSTLPRQKCNTK